MKIIQLVMTPNSNQWQGVLLGLGDNGVTYANTTDGWSEFLDDKEVNIMQSETDHYKNQVDILSESICEVLRLFDEDPSESKERDILNKALKDCNIGRWSEPCDPLKAIQDVIDQDI